MDKTKEIVEAEKKVDNAIAEVSKVTIKTDDDLANAATLLTNVTKLGKYVDQEKEKIVKPMRESMSAIRAFFAPLEDKIAGAQQTLKSAMGSYHDKKAKEIEKKQDSVAKRVESGQLREETGIRKIEEIGETKTNVKVETGAVAFKKIRKVRFAPLEKMSAEDVKYLIANKFVVWDEVLSKKAALAGLLGIGVEVYEETSVATSV